MNTFYYIEKDEVKELKTVKDFDFIKTKVNKNVVKFKKDLVIPAGFELKNKTLVKTKEREAEEKKYLEEQKLEKLIQEKLREIALRELKAEKKI